MKYINHKIYDINNNLIREEEIPVEDKTKDLETIAKENGLNINELLMKVQEYLNK